jgi:tetratricopeptide (TPR) repeat protein
MSRIIKIAGWAGKPQASVIFVHGLGGHAYDTWRRAPNDGSFWPLWLAENVVGVTVYTLAYEAPPSNWLGTAMPLQDRAVNVLECLLGTPGLTEAPVIFVCHSLGGLIVKQILLDLNQQKGRRPEAAALLECVREVVFLATPHTGSRQASLLDRLRFLAWPSPIARTLVANDPSLRAINVGYRGLAEERGNVLRHLIFYETRGTQAGVIVDEASADPGLPGRPPIPIDADHVSIAKPADRSSVLYGRTRDRLWEILGRSGAKSGFEAYPLPDLKREQPWNIVPKLIRLTLLAITALIVFKGVQALIAPSVPQHLEQKVDETNDLIRQLIARSSAPTGLGAEKAIGEAVAAAATGAAEGDERLGRALDLLRQNKTSEATDLFRAVAADKEARIRQDRADAAAAYRHLGAIAGLGDPKRALDAYAKALELDADDVESLYWVSWLRMERGNLSEAKNGFQRVLALATIDNQTSYNFWAKLGLGDVLVAQGNLPEALKAYQDGLAIAERLARADPGNAGWQRDLSVSYEKIGNVLVDQGNLPEALKAYQDGLAIRERLARADPGNAGWQRDLSVFYEKIGFVFQKARDKTNR